MIKSRRYRSEDPTGQHRSSGSSSNLPLPAGNRNATGRLFAMHAMSRQNISFTIIADISVTNISCPAVRARLYAMRNDRFSPHSSTTPSPRHHCTCNTRHQLAIYIDNHHLPAEDITNFNHQSTIITSRVQHTIDVADENDNGTCQVYAHRSAAHAKDGYTCTRICTNRCTRHQQRCTKKILAFNNTTKRRQQRSRSR